MMVKHIVEVARREEADFVYLHMQTSNEDAKRFYERHGFLIEDTIPDYYRINPGVDVKSAWVLKFHISKNASQ